MRNTSVGDTRLPPCHHIHYGHHHMGEGGTSAGEKEKTGRHAWVSHLLHGTAPRALAVFDRLTSPVAGEGKNTIEVFLK